MNIGIFDSGLGGLSTMRSIIKELPGYNYIYLGDTLHLPYGERTHAEIYRFLKTAVSYLFAHDCALIIVACNTASAQALRQIQQKYMPTHFPDRRVLGVIVPTIEEACGARRVGILATTATVQSLTYPKEFKKLSPTIQVFQMPAPTLVPLIESGDYRSIQKVIPLYLDPLSEKKIDTLILGCTHYPLIKKTIVALLDKKIMVLCQDEIIPKKLASYLKRHPDIEKILARSKKRKFLVTKKTAYFEALAKRWFGRNITLQKIVL